MRMSEWEEGGENVQKQRTLSRRVYFIAVPTLYCSRRRDGRPWPKVTKSTRHFLEGGSADLLVTVAVATLEPLLAALGWNAWKGVRGENDGQGTRQDQRRSLFRVKRGDSEREAARKVD